jgi:multicomponent Na+:H+ antiporter subunit A
VLSDNVISLFVFWELTSITSFFLIGFNNDDPASRKSSLLALAITGGGGFLLMAGLVLMGALTGTYSVQAMAAGNDLLKSHPCTAWLYSWSAPGLLPSRPSFRFTSGCRAP